MVDPFSAITGVLGIVSSVITLSNTVTRIVDGFKEASNEVRCLSRDIHHFFSTVRSLDIALREQIVKEIVESDEAILDTVNNLAGPLDECRTILTELMVRGIRLNELDGKGCTRFGSLKWSLVTKGEVRSIQLRLEAAKSTLISAQIAVSILVTVRSHGLLVERSSQKQYDFSALHTLKESMNASTIQLEDQVLDPVLSLVHQTHNAIVSDDPLLCQHVARIYRQLGEEPMQIQQLRTAIEQAGQAPRYDHADTARDVLEDIRDQAVGYDVAKGHDSSTTDVFLDCVSMFSMNDSDSSIDRLGGNFSGSPDYFLETSSTFHPELCATNSPSEMMFVSAILPLPSQPRSQRYFLTFQEKAHRWHRVIVVATFDSLNGPSDILQISSLETLGSKMMCLPKPVQSPLRKVLGNVNFFGSVTNLFVHLNENENGQIIVDTTRVEMSEHVLEKAMSKEDKILQNFKHLGCDQFKESQVFFRARWSCHRNKVWVMVRYCTERKIPFASGGLQGVNGIDEFVDEVVRLNTFRDCASNNPLPLHGLITMPIVRQTNVHRHTTIQHFCTIGILIKAFCRIAARRVRLESAAFRGRGPWLGRVEGG